MELVVRERGALRQLGKAFTALQRVGSHVFVEGTAGGGVVLRTLNTPKSAFCCFQFPRAFWDSVSVDAARDSVQFSLPLRGVLAVFRTIASADALAIHCAVREEAGAHAQGASPSGGAHAPPRRPSRPRARAVGQGRHGKERRRAGKSKRGRSVGSDSILTLSSSDEDFEEDGEEGARGALGSGGDGDEATWSEGRELLSQAGGAGSPDRCYFRVSYAGGYAKTFGLNCSYDCEIFEAVVDTSACPSRVSAPVKQLGGYLGSVRTNEVTFKLSPDVLHIRSHAGPWSTRHERAGGGALAPGGVKGESQLETDISIPGRNLLQYRVRSGDRDAWSDDGDGDDAVARAAGPRPEGVEMTFTVRELRAFFGYLDGTSGGQADVDMFCAEPGQPVVFRPRTLGAPLDADEKSDGVKAELVLATLIPPLDDAGGATPPRGDPAQGAPQPPSAPSLGSWAPPEE